MTQTQKIMSADKVNEDLVVCLYDYDASSRVMPGKKDILSEIKGRKRLLLDDIDNLNVKF